MVPDGYVGREEEGYEKNKIEVSIEENFYRSESHSYC
jgi:hypothetical protein